MRRKQIIPTWLFLPIFWLLLPLPVFAWRNVPLTVDIDQTTPVTSDGFPVTVHDSYIYRDDGTLFLITFQTNGTNQPIPETAGLKFGIRSAPTNEYLVFSDTDQWNITNDWGSAARSNGLMSVRVLSNTTNLVDWIGTNKRATAIAEIQMQTPAGSGPFHTLAQWEIGIRNDIVRAPDDPPTGLPDPYISAAEASAMIAAYGSITGGYHAGNSGTGAVARIGNRLAITMPEITGGAGTITNILAGDGLAGGGESGAVTVRLDVASAVFSQGVQSAEADGVFLASAASGISAADTSEWATAYGWGDHGAAGYATGTPLYVEADTAALGAVDALSGSVSNTFLTIANPTATGRGTITNSSDYASWYIRSLTSGAYLELDGRTNADAYVSSYRGGTNLWGAGMFGDASLQGNPNLDAWIIRDNQSPYPVRFRISREGVISGNAGGMTNLNGGAITGTVADARIASTLTRDDEAYQIASNVTYAPLNPRLHIGAVGGQLNVTHDWAYLSCIVTGNVTGVTFRAATLYSVLATNAGAHSWTFDTNVFSWGTGGTPTLATNGWDEILFRTVNGRTHGRQAGGHDD